MLENTPPPPTGTGIIRGKNLKRGIEKGIKFKEKKGKKKEGRAVKRAQ
jgi:hypothetical protein